MDPRVEKLHGARAIPPASSEPSGPTSVQARPLFSRRAVVVTLSVVAVIIAAIVWFAWPEPVIVSGHIETNGDKVWVEVVYVEPGGAFNTVAGTSTTGSFVLRGKIRPELTRNLRLNVDTGRYQFLQTWCSAGLRLPPLSLVDGRWVSAESLEPVKVNIKLKRFNWSAIENFDYNSPESSPPEPCG